MIILKSNKVKINNSNKKIIYEKGKIVLPDRFDYNLNHICSNGIHYFKTIDAAFYYSKQVPTNYTGYWINYHFEKGEKYSEGYYINGLRDGKWIYWYYTGQKLAEGCN